MNATISYSYLGIFGDCVKMFYKPFIPKHGKRVERVKYFWLKLIVQIVHALIIKVIN